MIIFKDLLTDDEVLSDSFDVKEIDGVVYEADGKLISVGGESFDTGANASAEDGDEEGAEDKAAQVIDIVYSFRLQSTQFDKKTYLTYLKGYMKAVKTKMQERGADADEIKDFETKAQGFAKKVVGNFKDYDFYTGESMNPDGMVILVNYREDGVTPYFTIWKHGVKEEKV